MTLNPTGRSLSPPSVALKAWLKSTTSDQDAIAVNFPHMILGYMGNQRLGSLHAGPCHADGQTR